jgi:hypothetical protein
MSPWGIDIQSRRAAENGSGGQLRGIRWNGEEPRTKQIILQRIRVGDFCGRAPHKAKYGGAILHSGAPLAPGSEGGLDRLHARVPRKVGCQGRSRFSGAFGTLDSPPFSEKKARQAIKATVCHFLTHRRTQCRFLLRMASAAASGSLPSR